MTPDSAPTGAGQSPVHMTTWALTGPAGAGKSVVSAMLASNGAVIIDGDRLGHEILARPDIQAEIVRRLGAGYVLNGVVDRVSLGARVFGDPAALTKLNEITHGPLAALAAEKLASLAAAGEHELAVFEAAVYFLLPSPPTVDLVVAVVAPVETRVPRLLARSAGRMKEAEARNRVAAQVDLEKYWPKADEIIVNDGTLAELEARVIHLLQLSRRGSETQP